MKQGLTPPFQGRGKGWVRASASQNNPALRTPQPLRGVKPPFGSAQDMLRRSPTPVPSLEREG